MPNLRALVACLLRTPLAACASQGFEVAAHTQTVSYREHMDPLLIVAASPPTCATLPPMTPTTYGGLIPLADMSFLLAMRSAFDPVPVPDAGQGASAAPGAAIR
jgi:hypothetical protein